MQVRLLLVQDFGLTTSEVESVLGSCDLESLVSSSGMATPRAELNNLGHYFEQVMLKTRDTVVVKNLLKVKVDRRILTRNFLI